jgi:hypothetical protein
MAEWFGFIVATLATWRLCHLVAHEDGPFDLIATLRIRAGQGQWGRWMDCPHCLSLWFALPFAFWLGSGAAQIIVLWLGLSGAACAIEHLAAALRSVAEPPVIDLPPANGQERG